MTEEGKRKRGRPLGSGENDGPTLMEVARYMVRDLSLKPTTAMKRVIAARRDWPATDETLLRRFQVKWRLQGQTMLARARREIESITPTPARNLAEIISQMDRPIPRLDPSVRETIAAMDRLAPVMQRIAEINRVVASVQAVERHFASPPSDFHRKFAEASATFSRLYPSLTGRVGGRTGG